MRSYIGTINAFAMIGALAAESIKGKLYKTDSANHEKVSMPRAKWKAHKASKKQQRKARRK